MQSVFEKINEKCLTDKRIGRSSLEAFLEIINEVEKEVTVAKNATDGWIPCNKEMPTEKGMYLVSYGKNTQVIVESYNGVWFDEHYYCEQPKAWMHRPKPYDEEGE